MVSVTGKYSIYKRYPALQVLIGKISIVYLFSIASKSKCLNNFRTALVYEESKVATKANLLALFIAL